MIDAVHDIQQAYRALVTAFSFPGTTVPLLPQERESGLQTKLTDTTILLAIILLDAEVTAYLHGMEENDHSLLRQLTSVGFERCETADFLFFPRTKPPEASDGFSTDCTEAKRIIGKAQRGTASDPHKGASVLINLPNLPREIETVAGMPERWIRLSGPGIAAERRLGCFQSSEGASTSILHDDFWWVGPRNTVCEEFPLGIELILYDDNDNVCAIPRSTEVELIPAEGYD